MVFLLRIETQGRGCKCTQNLRCACLQSTKFSRYDAVTKPPYSSAQRCIFTKISSVYNVKDTAHFPYYICPYYINYLKVYGLTVHPAINIQLEDLRVTLYYRCFLKTHFKKCDRENNA